MNDRFPVQAVAACVALGAFGVALIGAIVAERPAHEALASALWALLAGEVAGLIAAGVLAAALRESMSDYRRTRPIPTLDDSGAAARGKRHRES